MGHFNRTLCLDLLYVSIALLFEVKLDKHLLILHFLPQGAYIFGFLSWATTCHDRLLSLFLLSDAA